MAQQQIANSTTIAEELYKYNYVLHGECMRIASVCTSLGFSYDKEFNANKIAHIEEISDNILMLVDEVKQRLQNPQLQLTQDTLSSMGIHRIEHDNQYYYETQRNNLKETLSIQSNIEHIITENENNDSMEVLVDDVFDDSNQWMNSTFNDDADEEEEPSIVYLYSIGDQIGYNNEEDWD